MPDIKVLSAADVPASELGLLAKLETTRVYAAMSTEQLARGAEAARRIEQECMKMLEPRMRLFLQNLIGPPEGQFNMFVERISVESGRLIVRNLSAAQNVRPTRKFEGHDLNLLGILHHNRVLLDGLSDGSGGCVNFTVPLERFDRIVAGGPDAVRDEYPLLVDETCGAVGAEVGQVVR